MSAPRIVGLSVHQPWAWLIASGRKKIENRTWHPPAAALGRYVAIQASKKFDPRDLATLVHDLASASLVPATAFPSMDDLRSQCGRILAVGRLDRYVRESADPFFVGPVGWVLEDMVEIAPVVCRGQQGLFQLPPPVLEEVRQAYGRAVSARGA